MDIQQQDLRKSNDRLVDAQISYKKQFLAALVACLAPVCMGLVVGFSSPGVPNMIEPGHRFSYLDDNQKSLVSSLPTVGALIGGLVAGFPVDYFGRKLFLMITSIPYVIGWLFIIYSESVGVLYTGRLITGFCCGLTCLNTSVYLTEIASPQIRGILGSGFQLFVNVGVLLAYFVGSYVAWSFLAVFAAIFPVLIVILMIPMPESPVWLIRQGQHGKGLEALTWLRGAEADVQTECDNIVEEGRNETKMTLKEFMKPALLKPLGIMLGQMFIQQFCGINAVVFNAKTIFEQAHSTIPANTQATIIGSVMVVASIIAAFLMDKAGRRLLLLLSASLMGVGMFVLGGFFYMIKHDPETAEKLSWLPIVCLMLFVAIFNFGFGPIPWLMMSEMFPAQARGHASSLLTAFNWTLAFIITKEFESMQELLQPYGAFWLFGSVCMLAIVFILVLVPETKGKTIAEIEAIFTKQPTYDNSKP